MKPQFIPGLDLCRRFYFELILPLLGKHFPDLPHAAALIGDGSEVLGLDTVISMDHNWYPRVQLFLRDEDIHLAEPIKGMLRKTLPHSFLGFPLDSVPAPDDPGTHIMAAKEVGPVEHQVVVLTVGEFFMKHMNWDIHHPLEPADWLSISSQLLRAATAGEVYADNIGELSRLREQLAWYPYDVWLYLLASGWHSIDTEEPLMPRAGSVGDELGSAIIGSRLARDVMSLCFLMEKHYAPYPKWFGTAFRKLECAEKMIPLLAEVLAARTWRERETAFNPLYRALAGMHNSRGITDPLPEQVSNFFNRPFKIIHAGKFAETIQNKITDVEVQRIVTSGLLGSIDQFSDSTELRSNPHWRSNVRKFYESPSRKI